MSESSFVWIKIVCDSCGHSWDIRINREWLDMKAVVPTREQCAKCKARSKRLARRWHENSHQLRFRFEDGEQGGQKL